jgi:amino acid adenylation domain-containing protein
MSDAREPEPYPQWNATDQSFEDCHNLIALFEACVDRNPNSTALVFESQSLSYAELDAQANTAAHRLLPNLQGDDPLVAICLNRSLEMVVAVLATLKAGAAYVPLDPEYPVERLHFMLEDANVSALLTHSRHAALFGNTNVPAYTEDLFSHAEAKAPRLPAGSIDDLAYVIYTSGSTGQPKGVAMPHRPLVNLIHWQHAAGHARVDATTLQFAPLSFDVSFQEIFVTLCGGGTLVLTTDDQRLDPERLIPFLNAQKVERIFMPFIALQYFAEVASEQCLWPTTLREVITAGEQLKITRHLRSLFQTLNHAALVNQYGPTEAHVVSHYDLTGNPDTWPALPPIGRPIANARLYILNASEAPCAVGEEGELYVGGACPARGYLHRPDMTSDKFVPDRFSDHSGAKLYRTGDLCRFQTDGNIVFLGRTDDQLKIRGFRVELGEIESLIESCEGVRQATVNPWADDVGEQRLVAYIVGDTGDALLASIKKQLHASLPVYMHPSFMMRLGTLPTTPSGKVDRRALPEPVLDRDSLQLAFVAAEGQTEDLLSALWARLLKVDRVGVEDLFFDLGGNSLLALRFINTLRRDHGFDLSIARFFEHPTVRALARHLDGGDEHASAISAARARGANTAGPADDGIAIVGVALRVPGADDLDTFWDNLCEGRETIERFDLTDLDPSVPEEHRFDPDYVAARGIVKDADKFDAAFFGFTPRQAQVMDPQQRVFLELAWHALENAGYSPDTWHGEIGVFAGQGNNTYYPQNVLTRPDLIDGVGAFQVMVGNEKDYIATRLSHALNLTGPSLSVHTACSTSLVAVVEAFKSLRSGECDLALAGGVSISTPQRVGYIYQEGGMFSPDGHCRPFDEKAQGTLFNNGAGIVALKRLVDAKRDGDRIHAVIRGAAINNDGADKMSFSAPSVVGQAKVIAMAQAMADFAPDSIGYVEAHGTATPVGDPIEVEALCKAFGGGNKQTCTLGSLKGNMGHLIAASGVAGLIKAALCVERGRIPGTLHFKRPNPQISFADTPFRVTADTRDWPAPVGHPRRAGVSSFGVGGTNAHVVLEAAPESDLKSPRPSRLSQLFLFSGKTECAADSITQSIGTALSDQNAETRADAAYTLNQGRARLPWRRFVVTENDAATQAAFETLHPNISSSRQFSNVERDVVFVFPGQGAQYVGMGQQLYASEPIFRDAIDACAMGLTPILGLDIRNLMFAPAEEADAASEQLKQTMFTQPAIFCVEYAMAKLWLHWGIRPTAVIGHSVGEFTAACIAGVFDLNDALKLVATRGKLMQSVAHGSMLSVRAAAHDVESVLDSDSAVAAINSPKLCVLSGPLESMQKAEAELAQRDIACTLLATSHAFHSPMMDNIVPEFHNVTSKMVYATPEIPIMSTVTGAWMKSDEACDPAYWSKHLRQTVRFSDAVASVWTDNADHILLEVGPGTTSTTLARQQITDITRQVAIPSLGKPSDADHERRNVLVAVGLLWLNGIELDWEHFFENEQRRRLPLPAYPFERVRHWAEPGDLQYTARHAANEDAIDEGPSAVLSSADASAPRVDRIRATVAHLLEDTSGINVSAMPPSTTFVEMGLDSLFLTQISLSLSKAFSCKITFRQLLEDLPTLAMLSQHLDETLPVDSVQGILSTTTPETVDTEPAQASQASGKTSVPFGAQTRITTENDNELATAQHAALKAFIEAYVARTPLSKASTTENREQLADPRVVSGFRPLIKEMIYPIVVEHSKGSHLRDIDGNDYVDITCGFGSNFFGYSPDFIIDAVQDQLHKGYEIGPQHPLAGTVSKQISKMTGLSRVAFCNTGSEAVVGALRIARTVTGRNTVVVFEGAYHGIFDEVIIRGTPNHRAVPAAPGIMKGAVDNVLVVPYGQDDALDIIRANAADIAAILVEPVQSRRPDLQPREFLHACRQIATECGAAFIMDEVITGFRVAPGGAQEYFGVKADIATYGKIVGGGMPIGVIAGCSTFMDALDGGQWSFGDDSFPEVGVTYFAGTFVRHPLALAAAHAAMTHMEKSGPELQRGLNDMTRAMVDELNAWLKRQRVSLKFVHFGSLFKPKFTRTEPFGDVFFAYMRHAGVHVWDARPCFLTEAHTQEDVAFIMTAVRQCVERMLEADLLTVNDPDTTELKPVSELATTEAQREIWAATLMGDDASRAYNESVTLSLSGTVDLDALIAATKEGVARHESLRGHFDASGDVMLIDHRFELDVPIVDLSGLERTARATERARLTEEETTAAFDLLEGPLVRARAVILDPQHCLLLLTAHHTVCDGFSIDVVVRDIGAVYTDRTTGERMPLETPYPFSAFAAEEKRRFTSGDFSDDEAYWLDQFTGTLPVLEIPVDRERPPVKTYRGHRIDIDIPDDITRGLKRVGSDAGSTFVNVLLAAFKVFISRMSGQPDVVVGLPAAGQMSVGQDTLVGHCVNLLPLRSQVDLSEPYVDYLRKVRSTLLDAYEHQWYTFGTLISKLNPARIPGHVPLVPVIFNIDQSIDMGDIYFKGLQLEFLSNPGRFENFEFFLNAVDSSRGLMFECSYNVDLLDEATVRRWMEGFQGLLQGIIRDPSTRLGDLPILSAQDRNVISAVSDNDERPLPFDGIHDWVAQSADMFNGRPAVVAPDGELTFSELMHRADQLTAYLRNDLQIARETCVAFALGRSIDSVVAMLGILKAGGAYVPVDAGLPKERLEYILQDSGSAVLLCNGTTENELPDTLPLPIINLASIPDATEAVVAIEARPEDLAYVIYTSGSTGLPKGVMVEHRAVVNLVRWLHDAFYARQPAIEREALVSPFVFDVSVQQVFGCLTHGTTLYVVPEATVTDAGALLNFARSNEIDLIDMTPSIFASALAALSDDDVWPTRYISLGAEALPKSLLAKLYAHPDSKDIVVRNLYGPTECCVNATWFECTASTFSAIERDIPIGKALDGLEAHVVDERLRPVAIGVAGELVISGAGVARGYRNDKQKTQAAFVNDFGAVHGRAYRTGDKVRMLSDGNLVFVGRNDNQVKIRGNRVELEEIENVITRHPNVDACAVVVWAPSAEDQRLVAHLVLDGDADTRELRALLKQSLPAYMIPQHFLTTAALPLLPSGKVDRRALAAPELGEKSPPGEHQPPESDAEVLIAAVWQNVLKCDVSSRDSDFFDLGGHSMLAGQVIAQLKAQDLPVTLPMLLAAPTVQGLAAALEEALIAELDEMTDEEAAALLADTSDE